MGSARRDAAQAGQEARREDAPRAAVSLAKTREGPRWAARDQTQRSWAAIAALSRAQQASSAATHSSQEMQERRSRRNDGAAGATTGLQHDGAARARTRGPVRINKTRSRSGFGDGALEDQSEAERGGCDRRGFSARCPNVGMQATEWYGTSLLLHACYFSLDVRATHITPSRSSLSNG